MKNWLIMCAVLYVGYVLVNYTPDAAPVAENNYPEPHSIEWWLDYDNWR